MTVNKKHTLTLSGSMCAFCCSRGDRHQIKNEHDKNSIKPLLEINIKIFLFWFKSPEYTQESLDNDVLSDRKHSSCSQTSKKEHQKSEYRLLGSDKEN